MARQRKQTKPKAKAKIKANENENIRTELRQDILAIALFAAGVFIAVCLWQAPSAGEKNLLGAIGLGVYRGASLLFGQGRWLPAAALVLLGAGGWLKAARPGKVLYLAYTAVVLSGCAIVHLGLPEEQQTLQYGLQGLGGGLTGGALLQATNMLIGRTGSWILYIAVVAASVLLITGKTIRELLNSAGGKANSIRRTAKSGWSRLAAVHDEKKQNRKQDVIRSLSLPTDTALQRDQQYNPADGSFSYAPAPTGAKSPGGSPGYEGWNIRSGAGDKPGGPFASTSATTDVTDATGGRAGSADSAGKTGKTGRATKANAASRTGGDENDNSEFLPNMRIGAAGTAGAIGTGEKRRPVYNKPGLELLQPLQRIANQRQNKVITENVRILEKTLADFHIQAIVTQVNRGPSITRFELQPAPGVKVSRIVNLSDDIALALAATHIRIEAPIPGKAAIGIEVPNTERALVGLREVLEDPAFTQSGSKLTFALGRDIAGSPVVADLERMPHLLIAGSTGSGKSVCLNAMIASILFSATPDEVKMMMIDPKMVELSVYNDIPHLIHPVVTDPKKAAKALRWAVHEMERRYDVFAKAGVKDITRYNQWLPRQKTETTEDGERMMPQIVVIIDELADLMLVAPADVEESIQRLAQMARAAGMHLVVATQRPSVNVITGVIKANIASRIAFAVSSQTDSRVILDMAGAEKLLGRGDMLYASFENPKPVRVQGVYVSDREIEGLTDYIKAANQEPAYQEDILTVVEAETVEESEEPDDLLGEASRIFIESGQASISLLQRRLRIGYTRAARIIDQMEALGIVGGFEGSKARTIRMTLAQYEERFGKKA